MLLRQHRRLISNSLLLKQSKNTSLSSFEDLKQKQLVKDNLLVIHSTSKQSPTTLIKEAPPAYLASDAPASLVSKRQVRIYKPARNSMQSGVNETRYWQLDFDGLEKWENHLMGYVSSGDSQQALRMRFHTKEQAIYFAEKQGWAFIVQEEQNPVYKRKNYADNFKYSAGKLRLIRFK